MGVALETGESDAMGGVELPLVTQQLAQPQEHQAVRVPRQLGRQRLDVVSHGFPRRRASGRPRARGARRRAVPAPPPSAAPAAPTGPLGPAPRRTGPSRRPRSRAAGTPRRPGDRAAGRASAPSPPPPRLPPP